MRVVLQRVSRASVTIEGQIHAQIGKGFLILLAIEETDSSEDLLYLSSKIAKLRVFEDAEGKMNEDLVQQSGSLLIVSQFTLFAATKKGNRPSFIRAARPETAIPLYEAFIAQMKIDSGVPVESGLFGADMKVELVNDGPMTLLFDSKNKE
jgi:D-tyrosyl-tRNA(Tyr) deacylase